MIGAMKQLLGFSRSTEKLPAAASKSTGGIAVAGDVVRAMAGLPTHVVDGVTGIVDNVTDYLKVSEYEQTKRADIAARRDVALATIQAQRENISELIRYTFQERAAVLQKQFDALDKALAGGNVELVHAALNSMVAVIQSSPFKNVQELQKSLGSKEFTIRLE
jgi:hypothetical protein